MATRKKKELPLPIIPPPSPDLSTITPTTEDITPTIPRPISFDDRIYPPRPEGSPGRLSPDELTEHVHRLNQLIPVPSLAFQDDPMLPLHECRYLAWILGMTWQEIANLEGVDVATTRRSTFIFLLKMDMVQQIQARNAHSIARAHNDHNDKYFQTLANMFDEKSWVARSSALKHFRRTVGLEGQASALTVNLDNRKQTVNLAASTTNSFEQAMDRVRKIHAAPPDPVRIPAEVEVPIDIG